MDNIASPSPWHVEPRTNELAIVAATGEDIAGIATDDYFAAQDLANARLMAAAPELAAALQAILEEGLTPALAEQARAVLAKAGGKRL